jgi:hypothetical protein
MNLVSAAAIFDEDVDFDMLLEEDVEALGWESIEPPPDEPEVFPGA